MKPADGQPMRATTRLADLGSITVAGRTRSAGFGSISQNINSRGLEDIHEIDVATSIDLGASSGKSRSQTANVLGLLAMQEIRSITRWNPI